jgi:SAM-dependent methyltransferase
MRSMTLDEWNERYRSGEFSMEPAPLLVEAVRDLAPGRALDLACGAGRNALYLAELGWDVIAIDGASEAIRLLREHNASIDARVLDLERGHPLPFDDESFDLVAILYFLHRPLFAEARRVLRTGGLLVTAAKLRGSFSVQRGELRALEGFAPRVHRENETAELIAQKVFIHSKT